MNLCLSSRGIGLGAYGGLPQATGELAQALAERGHLVRLITQASSAPAPDLPGVLIAQLRLPEVPGPFVGAARESALDNLLFAAAVYREVRRVREQEQPVDAVITPLWRSEGAVSMLDEQFPTLVSCVTGLWILSELDDSYRRLPDIEQRLSLERVTLTRSRYLHGLTEASLSKTIRDFDLQPDVSGVVGRGLRDRHRPVAGSAGSSGEARVLFVGRIERRKGVDILLQAARSLANEELGVCLTLAGPERDPSIREAFEREVGDGRVCPAVRFTGAVPDAERDRLLAEADIVCLPSRYESHGIVLIEAMMFGKAIVTCDAGGIAEVVNAGHNALVVAPDDPVGLADSLRRLVHDSRLRARLGAAARETYERRFRADIAARRMEALVERVLAAHRPSMVNVRERLASLLHDVLEVPLEEADTIAAALLSPNVPTTPVAS